MGKKWDGLGARPSDAYRWHLEWAREALRVLKPGGHLLAFGGTRTHHRLWCALEDAGFEIRDTLFWVYGQGFPKSKNLDGDWQGWGTALKPAFEPICLARKPLSESNVAANVLRWGTGAINADGCRIGATRGVPASLSRRNRTTVYGKYGGGNPKELNPNLGRWPANLVLSHTPECREVEAEPATAWACVPGCPVRLLDERSGERPGTRIDKPSLCATDGVTSFDRMRGNRPARGFADTGGASRFFYTAKADHADRDGTRHPTVKSVDLLKWLVRLVTPPDGVVLDPFMGSGTTVYAARELGFRAIGIDREGGYVQDAIRRLRQGVLL